MKHIFLTFIILLAFQSCSTKFDVNSFSKNRWFLRTWTANKLPPRASASLKFELNNKISGNAFCNSFGGTVKITDSSIKFDRIFSTKKFCEGLSEFESKFLEDLQKIDSAKVAGGKLTLCIKGVRIMTFTEPR